LSLQTLALWFVCGFGTAILIAVTPLSRAAAALSVAAFAAGVWWAQQPFAPSPAAVALAAALVAIWQVTRAPQRPYAASMAGLLGGIWTAVLAGQGVSLLAAIAVAALLPALSAFLRGRSAAFAPPALVEEALIVLGVVGIAAAAFPGIADGWRAAVNLSVQGGQSSTAVPETALPVWTLAVASAALISGGLFSLWSRR
jgi:hypothetical protein